MGIRLDGRGGITVVGFLLHITDLVAETFGPCQGIDKTLGINGLESLLQDLVEEGDAGFGKDQVGHLVQVMRGHLLEDLGLAAGDKTLAKVTDASLNGCWGSMVNAGVELPIY